MSRALLALALGALLAGQAGAESFEKTFTSDGRSLTVTNLLGAVKVVKGSGSAFQITAKVDGADASPQAITFDESRDGLVVRFPVDEHRKYVYPGLGRGSRCTFDMREGKHGRDNDWFGALLRGGDRFEVRGRDFGGAVEMWADLEIEVPEGKELFVRLGCGQIETTDVVADVELRVKSGAVSVAGVTGNVLVDTGSGSVDVSRIRGGDLDVDTGSGSVDVSDVEAKDAVNIDTGSGGVGVTGVRARTLYVDTGSGEVEVRDADVKSLSIDTGSGSVLGSKVAADEALIDTGSGGVDLELVRMGDGSYSVDTGSGGIDLQVPSDVSAEFDLDTGSGHVAADIDGVTLSRRERQEAHFTVRGGHAQVKLSTGSGSVRVAQGR